MKKILSEEILNLQNDFLCLKRKYWTQSLCHCLVNHSVESSMNSIEYQIIVNVPFLIDDCIDFFSCQIIFNDVTCLNNKIELSQNFHINCDFTKIIFNFDETYPYDFLVLPKNINQKKDLQNIMEEYFKNKEILFLKNQYTQEEYTVCFNQEVLDKIHDYFEMIDCFLFEENYFNQQYLTQYHQMKKIFENLDENNLKILRYEMSKYRKDIYTEECRISYKISEAKKDLDVNISNKISDYLFHMMFFNQLEENNNYYIYQMKIIIPFMKINHYFKCLSFKLKKMNNKQQQRIDLLHLNSKQNLFLKAEIEILNLNAILMQESFHVHEEATYFKNDIREAIHLQIEHKIKDRYFEIDDFHVNYLLGHFQCMVKKIKIEQEIIYQFEKYINQYLDYIFSSGQTTFHVPKEFIQTNLSDLQNALLQKSLLCEFHLEDKKRLTKL